MSTTASSPARRTRAELETLPLAPPAATGLGEVVRRRYLLSMLVRNTIKSRYQGTVLGWLWSYLQPAIRFCMFYFLFQVMIGRGAGMENFAIHLFAGMVVVHFFTETFNGGTQSLVQNRSLITKLPVPREMFPVARMLVAGWHTIPMLVILVIPLPLPRLDTRPGGDGGRAAGLHAHRLARAGARPPLQRRQRLHARHRQGRPDPHPVRHVQRADDVPVHARVRALRGADRELLPAQPDGGGGAAHPARLLDRHHQRPGGDGRGAPARPPVHARPRDDRHRARDARGRRSGSSPASSPRSRSASDDHHDLGGERHQVLHAVLPALAQADRPGQGPRPQDQRQLQRRRRRQLQGARGGGRRPDGPQRLRQVHAAQAHQRRDAPRLRLGAHPRSHRGADRDRHGLRQQPERPGEPLPQRGHPRDVAGRDRPQVRRDRRLRRPRQVPRHRRWPTTAPA